MKSLCLSITASKYNHIAVGWHENKKLCSSFTCSFLLVLFYQTCIQQEQSSITSTCFTYFYTYCIFLCEKLRVSFCSLPYVDDKALAGQCSPGWVVHIVQFFTEKCWRQIGRSIGQYGNRLVETSRAACTALISQCLTQGNAVSALFLSVCIYLNLPSKTVITTKQIKTLMDTGFFTGPFFLQVCFCVHMYICVHLHTLVYFCIVCIFKYMGGRKRR